MKFLGYRRQDKTIGIRNHILVVSLDECCDGISKNIAIKVSGTIPLSNHYTCMYAGNEEMFNLLINVCMNPNIAGVIFISMGCGSVDPIPLSKIIEKSGRFVGALSVRELKGTNATIKKGIELAKQFRELADNISKTEGEISEIILGIKCGGSDTTSGLISNPIAGLVSDKFVSDYKATAVVGELIELITCEDILAKRAINDDVKKKIYTLIKEEERRWHVEDLEIETMSIGNSIGGLTTLEEKSQGALAKTGTLPIQDVLEFNQNMIQKPKQNGFYLSEVSHFCGASAMQFAALGAHIILWTTGSAGFNNSIIPVVRISGNPQLVNDDIDIDASSVIYGKESLDSMSIHTMNRLLKVIGGEKTNLEGITSSFPTLYQKDQRVEKLLKSCSKY